ncbi:hypothetical protein BC739_006873 [Kutzneria viridogrisea]|uniref:Uncharacterized protein n=2 Tax=Kutzneria TaxID=43356 RepID=W5WM24_9PSEU|nr:hypothetical protein [Kutzneria albida]AHI01923.1 hypothetical protein KALB_8566 [Kutzneria albida DSM 43870]MBA8929655.1 hypothetical protein [Kutzneria viridogrisea]
MSDSSALARWWWRLSVWSRLLVALGGWLAATTAFALAYGW